MGRDKAFLEYEGQPLWQRQIATLQKLLPDQLLISGPGRVEWSEFEVVPDAAENAGPLGGIAAALQECTAPFLVVLAVDLPRMTAEFLHSLLDLHGAVPRSERGFEPLAAVYPADCAALAARCLQRGDFSLQNFVRHAIEKKLLVAHTVTPLQTALFTNLNAPSDL